MDEGLHITEEVTGWIKKAEEDFNGATRLSRHSKPSMHNLVCFHAQQCAEKYLKAYLTAINKPFEFRHQLEKLLLPLCSEHDRSFEMLREIVRRLDAYSVDFRYPGADADRVEARMALKAARQVRAFVRERFGLKTGTGR
jgi:HEPN domain-containing protein